jgi:hypothetical protein
MASYADTWFGIRTAIDTVASLFGQAQPPPPPPPPALLSSSDWIVWTVRTLRAAPQSGTIALSIALLLVIILVAFSGRRLFALVVSWGPAVAVAVATYIPLRVMEPAILRAYPWLLDGSTGVLFECVSRT